MSNTKIIKPTNKFLVTQSNDLIESHYSPALTARAHKVARLIFSLISPDDEDLRTYTISIDVLKDYLGMKPNTRWGSFIKELKDIKDRLNAQSIELKQPDGEFISANFVNLKVTPSKGTVTFEISTFLKPYLLALKDNYTSYLLINIPKLKSRYSIRIYELLHQYRKIGKRYFDLEELQKKVGSTYQNKYNNFKKRVLLTAQKELKENTDLAFVFHERKAGRKIVGIQFIIFGNTPQRENSKQLSFLDEPIADKRNNEIIALSETIIIQLNKLGITEQNIAKYLAKGFDIITNMEYRKAAIKRSGTIEKYYLEKLEYVSSSKPKENPAGFFIKALQEDWGKKKDVIDHKQKEITKKRREKRKKVEILKLQIEKLRKEKEKAETPIIEQLINDKVILENTYKKVMEGLSDFMRKHVSSVNHLPIKQQYNQQMTIQMGIKFELMSQYPEKFEEASIIEKQIMEIQAEIQKLKN